MFDKPAEVQGSNEVTYISSFVYTIRCTFNRSRDKLDKQIDSQFVTTLFVRHKVRRAETNTQSQIHIYLINLRLPRVDEDMCDNPGEGYFPHIDHTVMCCLKGMVGLEERMHLAWDAWKCVFAENLWTVNCFSHFASRFLSWIAISQGRYGLCCNHGGYSGLFMAALFHLVWSWVRFRTHGLHTPQYPPK